MQMNKGEPIKNCQKAEEMQQPHTLSAECTVKLNRIFCNRKPSISTTLGLSAAKDLFTEAQTVAVYWEIHTWSRTCDNKMLASLYDCSTMKCCIAVKCCTQRFGGKILKNLTAYLVRYTERRLREFLLGVSHNNKIKLGNTLKFPKQLFQRHKFYRPHCCGSVFSLKSTAEYLF